MTLDVCVGCLTVVSIFNILYQNKENWINVSVIYRYIWEIFCYKMHIYMSFLLLQWIYCEKIYQMTWMCLAQGSQKGESALHAILLSHIAVSYCTSRDFHFWARQTISFFVYCLFHVHLYHTRIMVSHGICMATEICTVHTKRFWRLISKWWLKP